MNEQPKNKALSKALDLLSKRSYSKQILIDKLQEKEFPKEEIDLAIKKLVLLGFVDDKKYAENLVREYNEFKRYGSYRIKLKLKEKKVSDEIIIEALSKIDDNQEEENINELISKKIKSYSGFPKEKIYNRILGFLLRRGFSYEISKKMLKVRLG